MKKNEPQKGNSKNNTLNQQELKTINRRIIMSVSLLFILLTAVGILLIYLYTEKDQTNQTTSQDQNTDTDNTSSDSSENTVDEDLETEEKKTVEVEPEIIDGWKEYSHTKGLHLQYPQNYKMQDSFDNTNENESTSGLNSTMGIELYPADSDKTKSAGFRMEINDTGEIDTGKETVKVNTVKEFAYKMLEVNTTTNNYNVNIVSQPKKSEVNGVEASTFTLETPAFDSGSLSGFYEGNVMTLTYIFVKHDSNYYTFIYESNETNNKIMQSVVFK